MSDAKFFTSLSSVSGALGRGLVAGLAGTIAITVSQMIEMQFTKRGPSEAPMKVAHKVLGVEAEGKGKLEAEKQKNKDNDQEVAQLEEQVENNKQVFSQVLHFAYGTSWGFARSLMDLAGLRGASASLVHFGALWGAAQIMLPAANAAKPITQWPARQIAVDALHHAVYAAAAGAVYDAMPKGRYAKKNKWNIFK